MRPGAPTRCNAVVDDPFINSITQSAKLVSACSGTCTVSGVSTPWTASTNIEGTITFIRIPTAEYLAKVAAGESLVPFFSSTFTCCQACHGGSPECCFNTGPAYGNGTGTTTTESPPCGTGATLINGMGLGGTYSLFVGDDNVCMVALEFSAAINSGCGSVSFSPTINIPLSALKGIHTFTHTFTQIVFGTTTVNTWTMTVTFA